MCTDPQYATSPALVKCGFTSSGQAAIPVTQMLACCGNNGSLHIVDTCAWCPLQSNTVAAEIALHSCIWNIWTTESQQDSSLAISPFCDGSVAAQGPLHSGGGSSSAFTTASMTTSANVATGTVWTGSSPVSHTGASDNTASPSGETVTKATSTTRSEQLSQASTATASTTATGANVAAAASALNVRLAFEWLVTFVLFLLLILPPP